jgi:copper chaperone CopZ
VFGLDENYMNLTVNSITTALYSVSNFTPINKFNMENLKFKTTIKCSGCVAKVTPYLDEAVGKDNWKVDLQNPDRVLTVASETQVNEKDVVKALQDAGYKAEKVK